MIVRHHAVAAPVHLAEEALPLIAQRHKRERAARPAVGPVGQLQRRAVPVQQIVQIFVHVRTGHLGPGGGRIRRLHYLRKAGNGVQPSRHIHQVQRYVPQRGRALSLDVGRVRLVPADEEHVRAVVRVGGLAIHDHGQRAVGIVARVDVAQDAHGKRLSLCRDAVRRDFPAADAVVVGRIPGKDGTASRVRLAVIVRHGQRHPAETSRERRRDGGTGAGPHGDSPVVNVPGVRADAGPVGHCKRARAVEIDCNLRRYGVVDRGHQSRAEIRYRRRVRSAVADDQIRILIDGGIAVAVDVDVRHLAPDAEIVEHRDIGVILQVHLPVACALRGATEIERVRRGCLAHALSSQIIGPGAGPEKNRHAGQNVAVCARGHVVERDFCQRIRKRRLVHTRRDDRLRAE